MNENDSIYLQSDIHIQNRENIHVSGVKDVVAFSEEKITLSTQKGDLLIGGSALKIAKLDVESGELHIEGNIDSLFYSQTNQVKNESLFGRLFG